VQPKNTNVPDKEQYENWMNYGNSLYAAGNVKEAEEAWSIAEKYRPLTLAPKKPGLED